MASSTNSSSMLQSCSKRVVPFLTINCHSGTNAPACEPWSIAVCVAEGGWGLLCALPPEGGGDLDAGLCQVC